MTLFIACLIIYQFDMNPWLYAAATAIWAARPLYQYLMVAPSRGLIETMLN